LILELTSRVARSGGADAASARAMLCLCCSLSSVWGGALDGALGVYRWELEALETAPRRAPRTLAECRFPPLEEWAVPVRRDGTPRAVPGAPTVGGGYKACMCAGGESMRVLALRFVMAQVR
jgi:hypothetical protein